jgi:hypothetical protein
MSDEVLTVPVSYSIEELARRMIAEAKRRPGGFARGVFNDFELVARSTDTVADVLRPWSAHQAFLYRMHLNKPQGPVDWSKAGERVRVAALAVFNFKRTRVGLDELNWDKIPCLVRNSLLEEAAAALNSVEDDPRPLHDQSKLADQVARKVRDELAAGSLVVVDRFRGLDVVASQDRLVRERMQKLIDLCFELVIKVRPDMTKEVRAERAERAEWVAKSLKECGFDTRPMGMSWGVLK